MAEVDTEDFVPTQWKQVRTKPEAEREVPEAESRCQILMSRIKRFHRLGKENEFRLGQCLQQLKLERSRHRIGSYVKDVEKLKIGGYKRAERIRTFYLRVRELMHKRAEQAKRDKAYAEKIGWKWQDATDWERALDAKEDDQEHANRVRLNAEEDVRIQEAMGKREQAKKDKAALSKNGNKDKNKDKINIESDGRLTFQISLTMHMAQVNKFSEAWNRFSLEQGSEIILKAVCDAASQNKH